jgi:hypothetical protein
VRFIAQVGLHSNTLGVAIAQSVNATDATDAGGEIAALRRLLDRVELEGLLVQADALHANRHREPDGMHDPGQAQASGRERMAPLDQPAGSAWMRRIGTERAIAGIPEAASVCCGLAAD